MIESSNLMRFRTGRYEFAVHDDSLDAATCPSLGGKRLTLEPFRVYR